MMITTGVLAIVIGYLLGSVPSAYLIGRLVKGVDIREVGNGHMGASFAVRRLGLASGMVVGFMDLSKGVMAIVFAQTLDTPLLLMLLAGLAAVTGHNWSIFLGFKGGRGTLTSYGVLASLVLWQFLVALALTGIFYFSTRRSTLATAFIFAILPLLLWAESAFRILPVLPWAQETSSLLIVFPLFLFIPVFLKRPKKWIEEVTV